MTSRKRLKLHSLIEQTAAESVRDTHAYTAEQGIRKVVRQLEITNNILLELLDTIIGIDEEDHATGP